MDPKLPTNTCIQTECEYAWDAFFKAILVEEDDRSELEIKKYKNGEQEHIPHR